MRKFFALLKVSVKSMLLSSSNMGRKNRKKAATGVGVAVLIAFLGLYMSGCTAPCSCRCWPPSTWSRWCSSSWALPPWLGHSPGNGRKRPYKPRLLAGV